MLGAQVPGGPSPPPATLMEDKLLSFFFLQDTHFRLERFYGVVKRGQDVHSDKPKFKPHNTLTLILVKLLNFTEHPIPHQ